MKFLALTLTSLAFSFSAYAHPDFTLEMNKHGVALPIAIQSCSDITAGDPNVKSLGPVSMKLSKPAFMWGGSSPLNVYFMKVEMQSPGIPGGSYVQVYGDMDATIGQSSLLIPPYSSFYAACELRMGNIPLIDIHQDADIKVTVTASGYTDAGEAVTSSADINVKYLGVR